MIKRNVVARGNIIIARQCLENNPKDVQKARALIEEAMDIMKLQELEIDEMMKMSYPNNEEDLENAREIVCSYTSNCLQLEKLKIMLK
ncbi:MAG: hypothetical protein IJH12_07135 [Clostridia bacterium]|nr:hypothetical protein [Clostridia bacterium]